MSHTRIVLLGIFILLTLGGQAETIVRGGLTLQIPDNYLELNVMEFQESFPEVDMSRARGFKNPEASELVCTYDLPGELDEKVLTPDMLSQIFAKSSPHIKISRTEIKEVNGHRWYHFVYTDRGEVGPFWIEMFMTSKSGVLYGVVLRGTGGAYPSGSEALSSIGDSLSF